WGSPRASPPNSSWSKSASRPARHPAERQASIKEQPMARFTVNTTRFDPYLGYRFKIKWDGQYVAGLNKCGALKRTTEVTTWYEGGDSSGPHQIPGKTKYDPITLEAGVTHDTAFEDWANKVNNYDGDAAMSLASFRKDISIEVFNPQ